jgi:hypothetical protein
MNSVEVDLAVCKELMISRALMLKADFLPGVHVTLQGSNPNRTEHTNSGEIFQLIEIQFLLYRWFL